MTDKARKKAAGIMKKIAAIEANESIDEKQKKREQEEVWEKLPSEVCCIVPFQLHGKEVWFRRNAQQNVKGKKIMVVREVRDEVSCFLRCWCVCVLFVV